MSDRAAPSASRTPGRERRAARRRIRRTTVTGALRELEGEVDPELLARVRATVLAELDASEHAPAAAPDEVVEPVAGR